MVTQKLGFAPLFEKHIACLVSHVPVFGKSVGSGDPEVDGDYKSDFPSSASASCFSLQLDAAVLAAGREGWSVVVQLGQNSLAATAAAAVTVNCEQG